MDCYAGLDVSLEATHVCVVNGEGKVIREGILPFDPDAIELFLAKMQAFSAHCWKRFRGGGSLRSGRTSRLLAYQCASPDP